MSTSKKRSKTSSPLHSNKIFNMSPPRGSMSFMSKQKSSKNKSTFSSPSNQILQEELQKENFMPKRVKRMTNQEEEATKKIKRFMKKSKHKIRANFLNAVCSDSHVCFGFGLERNKIKAFFGNFCKFHFLKGNLIGIGSPTSNGFVKELTYERHGYFSNAVLKSNRETESDNLGYEACVGNFLNKVGKRFPCFLETYGLFYYKDHAFYEKMKNNREVDSAEIIGKLSNITTKIFGSHEEVLRELEFYLCSNSLYLSVLIEHLKNAPTLFEKFEKSADKLIFREYEFLPVLFQIYFPLAMLSNTFTHYDLHPGNVLIYHPKQSSYIEYKYYLPEPDPLIITINSKYIAKIIDYGRCYFFDRENPHITGSSEELQKFFLSHNNCHIRSLFYNLATDFYEPYHFIVSSKANHSHDLKLLTSFDSDADGLPEPVKDLLGKIVYKTQYGTPPTPDGFSQNLIRNVLDVLKELKQIIGSDKINDQYDNDVNLEKLGTLHIYSDGRPIKFEKQNR